MAGGVGINQVRIIAPLWRNSRYHKKGSEHCGFEIIRIKRNEASECVDVRRLATVERFHILSRYDRNLQCVFIGILGCRSTRSCTQSWSVTQIITWSRDFLPKKKGKKENTTRMLCVFEFSPGYVGKRLGHRSLTIYVAIDTSSVSIDKTSGIQ